MCFLRMKKNVPTFTNHIERFNRYVNIESCIFLKTHVTMNFALILFFIQICINMNCHNIDFKILEELSSVEQILSLIPILNSQFCKEANTISLDNVCCIPFFNLHNFAVKWVLDMSFGSWLNLIFDDKDKGVAWVCYIWAMRKERN